MHWNIWSQSLGTIMSGPIVPSSSIGRKGKSLKMNFKSFDDLFTDLNGAEVNNLRVLENLSIKNNNSI